LTSMMNFSNFSTFK